MPPPAVLHRDLGYMLLVGAGIAVAFVAMRATGGPPSPFIQVVYLPILAAAHRWGWRGGLAAALLAAVVLGPLTLLLRFGGEVEDPAAWSVRTVAFAAVGSLTGFLFDRNRRARTTADANASQAVGRERERHRLAYRAERNADRLTFQTSLLEEVQSAVIATDLDNRITYWNRAADAIYGWTSDEAVGQDLHELVSDDPDQAAAVPRSVVRDGRRWMGVMRDKRKDGSVVMTSVSAVPLHDADGRIIGGIGTATDITDQNAAAESVRSANLLLAAVLDAAPQAIILIDGLGRITEWNRGAERQFGWLRRDAIGRNAGELVAPMDVLKRTQDGIAAISTVAAGDFPRAMTFAARDRDGATFLVALTMAPVGTPEQPSFAIFVTPTGGLDTAAGPGSAESQAS